MKRGATFNFRLPSDLKARLDKFSEDRDISKADIMIAAIREFMDQVEKHQISKTIQ